jgi:hypothetical protein
MVAQAGDSPTDEIELNPGDNHPGIHHCLPCSFCSRVSIAPEGVLAAEPRRVILASRARPPLKWKNESTPAELSTIPPILLSPVGLQEFENAKSEKRGRDESSGLSHLRLTPSTLLISATPPISTIRRRRKDLGKYSNGANRKVYT